MASEISPEPDANPLLVPSLATDQQRPSIISLGPESRGLPGLLHSASSLTTARSQESRGFPGLLHSASSLTTARTSGPTHSLGEQVDILLAIESAGNIVLCVLCVLCVLQELQGRGGISVTQPQNTGNGQYAITEFIDEGFIISTDQVCSTHSHT